MLKIRKSFLLNSNGFTLLELLVVIVIIGLLASIAIPSFSDAAYKSKNKKVEADIRVLQSAAELYYAENNKYPEELHELVDSDILKEIPKDPWGGDYKIDNGEVSSSKTSDE
ncbi:prepilin-type N-terminal cleavage/methylation domain-containing protein [Bacillota bacterium LX-D]|nr:prepilin-type N-terminal cleavage/methylation domain-containing protein [Bacillota bacterium LX-D]